MPIKRAVSAHAWVCASSVAFILAVLGTGVARPSVALAATSPGVVDDFDGDGVSDLVFYRPSSGDWAALKSSSGFTASSVVNWGGPDDTAVPGDYDGDGRADYGRYAPATGTWQVLLSGTSDGTTLTLSWGGEGYVPVPGDYDGDGKTDPAVFAPATGAWSILTSSSNFTSVISLNWGGPGYQPIAGWDFDGDNKADPGGYSVTTGVWYVVCSSTSYGTYMAWALGDAQSLLVPGNYDGDGKADPAVYNQTTGDWRILKSSANYVQTTINHGGVSAAPVPVDVDADGVVDLAVYAAATGGWSVLLSGNGYNSNGKMTRTFGLPSDQPARTSWLTRGDDTRVVIESPAPGGAVKTQPFALTGWAIGYPATSGTGVDQVKVLAYPNPGSGTPPIDLGLATVGGARGTVAAAYGAQYQNAGWTIDILGLAPKVYRFAVSAHVVATNTWTVPQTATVTVDPSAATPAITPPGGTFTTAPAVTLGPVIAGSEIHFRLDGIAPTATSSSTLYTAAFALTQSAQLRAVRFQTG